MAYAYDLTMQALGDPNNQAVGQSGAQQPASSGGGLAAGSGTQSAGGGNGATQGQSATMQSSTASRNRLLDRNQGDVKSPIDVGALKTNLEGANKAVTDEADNYVKNAASLYDYGDGTQKEVQNYAKLGTAPRIPGAGDETALTPRPGPPIGAFEGAGKITPVPPNWLQLFQGGQQRVDPMAKSTVQTDFSQINDLANDAGTRNAFRKHGDAEYSAGEAALDTALLSRNPGFAQQRDQALRANDALQKQVGTIHSDAQNRAQAARDQAMAGYKAQIRGQLGGYASDIENKATADEARFDDLLGQEQSDAHKQAIADAQWANIQQNPEWRGGERPADVSSYFKPTLTADKTGWRDFLGEDEAGSYNRILGALGQGGAVGGAGQYAGKNLSDVGGALQFDVSQYRNDQLGKSKAKDAADAARVSPFENAYSSDMSGSLPPEAPAGPNKPGKSPWDLPDNPVISGAQKGADRLSKADKKTGGPWTKGNTTEEAQKLVKKLGINA